MMRSDPIIPPSKGVQGKRQLQQSYLLLALWTLTGWAAILLSSLEGWEWLPLPAILFSAIFLLALWFSLQWDIVQYYIPDLHLNRWKSTSTAGFALGVSVGWIVGVGSVYASFSALSGAENPQFRLMLPFAAVAVGLSSGFAVLGWWQALELRYYIRRAWWWVGAMALAWVPAPLAYLGYGAGLQWQVVNIYPEAHGRLSVLVAQVALLCPILGLFTVLARRSLVPTTQTMQELAPNRSPTAIRTAFLVPPIAVALAAAVLLVGQALRVERAWFADGPAYFLRFGADGQVSTAPVANEGIDDDSRLSDRSSDGSLLAQAEDARVVIYRATDRDRIPVRTLQVFSEPPPEDYYADDVINVVRFSPDGALLAVGTGQATEGDSYINASHDHSVHVWSVEDGHLQFTLSEPQYRVRAVAWSPDSGYLAAGGGLKSEWTPRRDNVVRVWRFSGSLANKNLRPEIALNLTGHTTIVEALAWSPDGSRLASRDLSGRVVVWRIGR